MAKWIEEENGEVWIPTSTVMKMLGMGRATVHDLIKQGLVTQVRRRAQANTNYYLISEVETLAREPKRLNKILTHEARQEDRLLGDPSKVDETFMTGTQVKAFLGIDCRMLSYYVNRRQLTSYQRVPGRSPHRFDPYEVRVLRNRRERLARIRATNVEFREWDAQRCRRTLPPPIKHPRLCLGDLKPVEQVMGTWISARQTAALLGIGVNPVYDLRKRGRLYGELRFADQTRYRKKRWFFRKVDVMELLNDPDYRKARELYETHCTPLASRIKAEQRVTCHTPPNDLDWEAPGSQWRVIEGGDW